ncbi:uncharacterized protein B0H18DRAFT_26673 [Fomitopsis serialis]|uniref:uncharacterized protein n=1 Tax=Fomitopsis serialis TaxID=139415 RepID=UPI002008312A|nr:uncharacterized protein B0H18DRAFT_26673 [Neoantrodia serialis]KAH9932484.1 hypothetical protein B0H18DRAFT_26673 [Neoantrodia serialis]
MWLRVHPRRCPSWLASLLDPSFVLGGNKDQSATSSRGLAYYPHILTLRASTVIATYTEMFRVSSAQIIPSPIYCLRILLSGGRFL